MATSSDSGTTQSNAATGGIGGFFSSIGQGFSDFSSSLANAAADVLPVWLTAKSIQQGGNPYQTQTGPAIIGYDTKGNPIYNQPINRDTYSYGGQPTLNATPALFDTTNYTQGIQFSTSTLLIAGLLTVGGVLLYAKR